MDRLVTQENICQQEFKSLMDICFRDSEYFSLTRFGGHAKPHFSHTTTSFTEKFQAALAMQDAILQALSRFRISTIETTKWFYISTVPYLYVDLYKATTDSLQILLSYYDNLFLRFHPQISMLPADLCFFHANQLWLGSCSHEKICIAFPSDNRLSADLQQYGKWTLTKETETTDIQRLHLSDFVKL